MYSLFHALSQGGGLVTCFEPDLASALLGMIENMGRPVSLEWAGGASIFYMYL